MDPAQWLHFEAGRVAASRGWADPVLLGPQQIRDLGPGGSPVVVVGSAGEISPAVARAAAALLGAGRRMVLVVDGHVDAEAAAWLPEGALVTVASPSQTDRPRTAVSSPAAVTDDGDSDDMLRALRALSDAETRPFASAGRFCAFGTRADLSRERLDESGRAALLWDRFVSERGLSVTRQPSGISAGPWMNGADGVAVLWFKPVRRPHEQELLVGTTLGTVPADSGFDVSGSPMQDDFAERVTRWCEQPEGAAMLGRVLGIMSGGGPRDQFDCYDDAARGMLPERYLFTEESASLRVWPQAGVGHDVAVGHGRRSLGLVYAVPAYAEYETFDAVLAHVMDSLVRVHTLLADPTSELEGRRPTGEIEALRSLIARAALTPVTALAAPFRTQPDPAATASGGCPQCGAASLAGDDYCGGCGTRLPRR